MDIAVVSFYAVTNIGDKILTETVCWFLRKMGHNTTIVDLNGRYTYKYSGFIGKIERVICPFLIKRNTESSQKAYFKKTLKNKDFILFAGGQIIDTSVTNCSYNIYNIVKIAEEEGIPVGFNAVGLAGRDFGSEKGKLLKYALSSLHVVHLTARERIDDINTFLLSPTSTPRAKWVCDTAVWCSECYNVKVLNRNSKLVGINVVSEVVLSRYHKEAIDFVKLYADIYSTLTQKGFNCYFFTNGVQRDNLTLYKILEYLNLSSDRIMSPTDTNKGKSFIKMLSQFGFIISSRLHTSISAYSLKIPTIALAWDDKIPLFYKSIGYTERCIDILQSNNKNYLIDLVSNTWSNGYDNEKYNNYRKTVFDSLNNISFTI